MRAVIQRVTSASVDVGGNTVGQIGRGFLVLLGVTDGDDDAVATRMAEKVAGLRVFEDEAGKMNLDLAAVNGAILCISQFTLYGDVRKGRRPSFDAAARPEVAAPLYDAFCAGIERQGIHCERGVFGAEMQVSLVNDGPVTLILDSADMERPRRA